MPPIYYATGANAFEAMANRAVASGAGTFNDVSRVYIAAGVDASDLVFSAGTPHAIGATSLWRVSIAGDAVTFDQVTGPDLTGSNNSRPFAGVRVAHNGYVAVTGFLVASLRRFNVSGGAFTLTGLTPATIATVGQFAAGFEVDGQGYLMGADSPPSLYRVAITGDIWSLTQLTLSPGSDSVVLTAGLGCAFELEGRIFTSSDTQASNTPAYFQEVTIAGDTFALTNRGNYSASNIGRTNRQFEAALSGASAAYLFEGGIGSDVLHVHRITLSGDVLSGEQLASIPPEDIRGGVVL